MSLAEAAATRKYYAANRAKPAFKTRRAVSAATNYANKRESRLAAAKVYAAENPLSIRHNDLMRKYGISLGEFWAMIESQAGLCGICTEPMGPGRDTCVDHDHTTNKVRMLLCRSCNTRLGRIEVDPLVAQASFEYREQFQCL